MGKRVIKKKIIINATSEKVWQVFIDPNITRQMGGEYVTDWKVGSSIGWKGQDGNMHTSGTILQMEQEKILKHNLHHLNDKENILSIISYTFKNNNGKTIISAEEELYYEISNDQFKEASEGWDLALKLVKETAEKL